ncbi:interferon-induced GTP-binding protein Mx2 [Aspergillus ellipticus CBS 707.79]|uniref:Interferon-induced GTP-binding protein Mx2 n=1 Tax=Aspergillus ellipticus CBS 707.79 TaxID=1448320 RepID=A0A319D820_9EURO|nr:interferon-induced GTP-binding protein Mx2 [Aspergillus ellipticus CBS 707.79]
MTAQKADESSLLSTSDLLRKIDKLRENNVGQHVPLPQLVVAGDQSSGKSSLLESLTGIPFPRDLELCTRYATQITSRREAETYVDIRILPAPDASEDHKQKLQGFHKTMKDTRDFRAQFPVILKEVNACMGIRSELSSNEGTVFSKDVLRIELCGPSEDYLTVIDVPGIFRDPTSGITTDKDIHLVLEMVKNYIRDKRTVILAVLPSNVDIATQEILKLAGDYDEAGERTLGVLTKPDLLTERSAKIALCSLILGQKRPLKLGYYVARNRGADDNDSFDHTVGEEIFNQDPWNILPRDRIGVKALRVRLGELLNHITQREFPSLRKDISKQIEDCERELSHLGPKCQTEQSQRAFLSKIACQFQDLAVAACDATYSKDYAFEACEFRLLTHVVNISDFFCQNFEKKAHFRSFRPFDPAKSSSEQENPDADYHVWRNSKAWSSLNLEQYSSNEISDRGKAMELEQVISFGMDLEDPQDGIEEWIEQLYLKSRGLDMGSFGGNILSLAFREQTIKWEGMTMEYVSKIIMVIHRFCSMALERVCANKQLCNKIWSHILPALLAKYRAATSQVSFLLAVERSHRPYTLNHYFNENLQKLRVARLTKELNDKARKELKYDSSQRSYAHCGNSVVDLDVIKQIALNQSNMEFITKEIHDVLWSYYKVARKRFVDNVYMQVVDHCLLNRPESPLKVFSQEWVLNLSADELEAIAGESPATKMRRAMLVQKLEELRAAMQILEL